MLRERRLNAFDVRLGGMLFVHVHKHTEMQMLWSSGLSDQMQMHTAYTHRTAVRGLGWDSPTMAKGEQIANIDARRYVDQVLEATGKDATSLARQAGLNPSTLTGIMARKPRTQTVRRSTLEAIAAISGVPLFPELASLERQEHPSGRSGGGFVRDVPVTALLAVPGRRLYHWNQIPGDYAPRPPGIVLARKVFALRMPDHTMAAWRRKNELIYVDSTIDADEGDHAFIEIANVISPDGPSLYIIRRFVADTPAGAVIASWGNKPEEARLAPGEMIRAMRILEWPELIFG